MINPYFPNRTARPNGSGGFTLVELLVVIGIIAILAGVALGPITRGIKQAQESASVQVSHQLGVIEFAYSNDNNQTYPYATNGYLLANVLLAGNYVSDPSIFYVNGTPNAVKYTGADVPPKLADKTQCNWDFMINGKVGLSSSTSDACPLVQLVGGTVKMGTAGPIELDLDTTMTAFQGDGIAVYYKGNSAKFIKANTTAAGKASVLTTAPVPYIDGSFNDNSGATYALTAE